ncbi:PDGLE domain-containing protein [Protaetiibacter larvae]|uniref:PDGLE domain-containing protein n=1 Tax=Protaetiibacter larvae TaxID=2592654 RepID=UPI00143D0495|nr:PDGLE domain-containing protein [Protaetiibacter larvae]
MTAVGVRRRTTTAFVVVALALSLLVAGLLRAAASPLPDGLMHVAAATGFADSATEHPLASGPLAGYAVAAFGADAGLLGQLLGPLLVGVVGVGAVFGMLYLALAVIARAAARPSSDSGSD